MLITALRMKLGNFGAPASCSLAHDHRCRFSRRLLPLQFPQPPLNSSFNGAAAFALPPFYFIVITSYFLTTPRLRPDLSESPRILLAMGPQDKGGGRTGQGGEGTFVFYFFMLTNIYFMLHEVAGVYLAGSNLGREERNVKISRNLLEAPPNQR